MPINENENILLNRKFAPKIVTVNRFCAKFCNNWLCAFLSFFCITRRLAFEIKEECRFLVFIVLIQVSLLISRSKDA